MAVLAAIATGNFTAASTWAILDAASFADSESSQALTTTDQNSATFIPAAQPIDAVLLKLAVRASGTPTNTITITLRNNTTATDILSVTVNVSDLPVANATVPGGMNGGWHAFKFASTHTPNGTDSYLVRARLSATTTAVNLWRGAVSADWARGLRTTNTAAPAAGDRMIITQVLANGVSPVTFTVTMNNTTTTQFGAGGSTTSLELGWAVAVGKGCSLVWATTAATTFTLRLSGHLTVFSGGIVKIGDSTTPIPRDSVGILEFVVAADGDSGLAIMAGGSFYAEGLSRTSGKNVVWTLLTSDAAAAATSVNVADDTGWLNGDEVGFAPTTRTRTDVDLSVLNANAGASSLSLTAGLAFAHAGSAANYTQGEVGLLTRNVKIRSTSSTLRTFVYTGTTVTAFEARWVEFRYLGLSTGDRLGLKMQSAFTMQYCAYRDFNAGGVTVVGAIVFTLQHCVFYRTAGTATWFIMPAVTGTTWVCDDLVCLANAATTCFDFSTVKGTITNIRAAGGSLGIDLGDVTTPGTPGTLAHLHSHSNTNGINFAMDLPNGFTWQDINVWRNFTTGLVIATGSVSRHWRNVIVDGFKIFGNSNASSNLSFGATTTGFMIITFRNGIIASETSYPSSSGVGFGGDNQVRILRWENVLFGSQAGKNSHAGLDDYSFGNAVDAIEQHTFWDSKLDEDFSQLATSLGGSMPLVSYLSETNGKAGIHRRHTVGLGESRIDSTTFHTAAPSERLFPGVLLSGWWMESGPKRVAIPSGSTATVNVWVRKDTSYGGGGGSQPRLVLKANPGVGIDTDTVLDTMTVGTNTWEQLTGTTAAAAADGVFEFVVQCDANTGSVYVDDWSLT